MARKTKTAKRITILGHSVTSVLKWLGFNGFTFEQAQNVVTELATAKVKPSTIHTGLSDGRSKKYHTSKATLTVREARQVKRAAA